VEKWARGGRTLLYLYAEIDENK